MRKLRVILRKQATRCWRWLVKWDVPTYLLFVLLASVIWWGSAMSTSREARIVLPIVYTDIPEQIEFDTPLPTQLTVTVRDNGKQLRQISRAHHELTLSIESQLTQNEGVVQVSAEILRPKLQDMLPGSTVVLQVQPEVIEVTYHKLEKKTVPVQLQAQWSAASQYQMVGEPQVTPQQVNVYGRHKDLRGIRSIATDSIVLNGICDSVRYQAMLTVPEGLRVSPAVVEVLFVAEQFTEKTFVLPVQVQNVPRGESLILFPHEVSVSVRVCMSHFAEVNEQDFSATCAFPKTEQASIPVTITHHNPYVTNVRVTPDALEYIIER